jgi:shikimate 5-dehydrogenase/shikimate kinase
MAQFDSTDESVPSLHQQGQKRKGDRSDHNHLFGKVNGSLNGNGLNLPSENSSAVDTTIPETEPDHQPIFRLPASKASIYDNEDSILLVGMSGAGKKTLGVMASMALRRRYVDFKLFFEKRVGVSPSEHLAQHGLAAHRRTEVDVTAALLKECCQNHIIGGLSELGTNLQRELLKDFAKTHPVIYVQRAKEELRTFMASSEDKFDQWYKYRDAFYRSCSNLDFYNISYAPEGTNGSNVADTLKLKDTETDFIRFLRRVFGRPLQLLESKDPFSSSYTYALQVPLTWMESRFEYEELECGADVINLVIDVSDSFVGLQSKVIKQMAVLRRRTRAPIIFEARYFSQNPSTYFAMLKLGARTLPDALAVDLAADPSQITSLLQAIGSINIIGTFCQSEPWECGRDQTPWPRLQATSKLLSCKALRISHDPGSVSDNLACMHFVQAESQHCDIPLVAYNTGTLGRTSVCFNPVLSPVTLSSMPNAGITVKQAQSALYSCFYLTKKKFTIFGKSVSYSLSPAMHNAAYEACGMPHSYRFLESNNFSNIRHVFEEDDCGGLAVTLPFKTEVLPLLHSVSPEARDIGAVNTIVVDRVQNADGSRDTILKGFNTDHIGIRQCIYRHLSPANSVREGTSALILGAGGMARAAIFACRTLGVKNICVYNRTLENAQKLAQYCASSTSNICILQRLDEAWPGHLRQSTIIISTIPAHNIDGNAAHELDIPEQWLQSRTGGVFIEVSRISLY